MSWFRKIDATPLPDMNKHVDAVAVQKAIDELIASKKSSNRLRLSEEIVLEFVKFGFAVALLGGSLYLFKRFMYPDAEVSKITKRNLAEKLKRPEIEIMEFSAYEAKFFSDIIGCHEIDVNFNDIGGLHEQLEDVKDHIILPLEMWSLLHSRNTMLPCPTGVLLYGQPGTGKTLTAKAIAKEGGATFINIKSSSIMDKYIGETDKLVHGLFSLARKLAPSIIFIDEIDTLLGSRSSSNNTSRVTEQMQGLFLQEWDGLTATNEFTGPVIVLGATNRLSDIDPAFMRRMPFQMKIPLPTRQGRLDIFKKLLKNEQLDRDVNLEQLADYTEAFTGSDIREIIRLAVTNRIKMISNDVRKSLNRPPKTISASSNPTTTTTTTTTTHHIVDNGTTSTSTSSNNISISGGDFNHMMSLQSIRPLSKEDFHYALSKTKKQASTAYSYNQASVENDINYQSREAISSLMKQFFTPSNTESHNTNNEDNYNSENINNTYSKADSDNINDDDDDDEDDEDDDDSILAPPTLEV